MKKDEEGKENNIVVKYYVEIKKDEYKVIYIMNVNKEKKGKVKVYGKINRDMVKNINKKVKEG